MPNRVVNRGSLHLLRVDMQLCGQHYLAAEGLQRLSHQLLVVAGPELLSAIGFGGVEEGAAKVMSPANGLNGTAFLRYSSIAVGKAHAAHANRAYLQVLNQPCFHRIDLL